MHFDFFFALNTQEARITAGSVFLLTVLVGRWLRVRLFPYLFKLTGNSITSIDDVIMLTLCRLSQWFYIVLGLRLASRVLLLPPFLETVGEILFVVIVIGQLGQGSVYVVLQLIKEQWFESRETHNFIIVSIIIKAVLWTVIGLLILTNLGIQITPLLASLGVIGIAVSFALQSILEDLFASVSIYLDKPFRIGDYITLDAEGGTVEHVGIKTTRLRTVLGEELVIANRKLTEAKIHNYGKIDQRTITHSFLVPFGLSGEQQTMIPNLVAQACEFTDVLSLQRCHLTSIDTYGLRYEYRYTVHSKDYPTHLQLQEKVLMNILENLSRNHISIEKPLMRVA